MWIRMITTAAGPRLPHAFEAGTTYKAEDELGQELVKVLAAVEVADPNPKKPEAPVEVSSVDDGERATEAGTEKKSESLIDKLKGPKKS
jgi:hypothetical protein